MSDAEGAGASPRPHRVLSLVLVNQRREIARLGRAVDQFAAECRLSDDDTASLNLLLDELVTKCLAAGVMCGPDLPPTSV